MRNDSITPDLLISAYAQGAFPMGMEDGRIAWFSPDPRAILPLESFHASKTLMQTVRSGRFELRVNGSFREVMEACADRGEGTWITDQILDVYCELHEYGLAHSVEAYRDNELVGGLYGVALRGAFFGESMFHRQRDASKVALVGLVHLMRRQGYALLDVQFQTPHLKRFGTIEIAREAYLQRLDKALQLECAFVPEEAT